METTLCPNCGQSRVFAGLIVPSSGDGAGVSFSPAAPGFLGWTRGMSVPGAALLCLSCGHLWIRKGLAPMAFRTFVATHGRALSNEVLNALFDGPAHDLPDLPEAREAAGKVAEIDALMVSDRQPEATRRYRELTGTTWDLAIDTVRHWRDRKRAEKLALFGWQPAGKPLEPSLQGHPLHDPELDSPRT